MVIFVIIYKRSVCEMELKTFIKQLISSPLKLIGKIFLYFAKVYLFYLSILGASVVLGFIKNAVAKDIAFVIYSYSFFALWTYLQRYKNSDAETDYTELIGERRFDLFYEIRDVIKRFKWNLALETLVFYIVITLFMPSVISADQNAYVYTVGAVASYVLQPLFNVLIWVFVRKKWYTKYRRWARRKKKQEFVDTSTLNNTEERID